LHGPQGVGTLHRDHSLAVGAWQSFIVDEVEEAHQVGKVMLGKCSPKPWVAYKQRVDQYDAVVGFLMMPIFRIQARNPFILCMVILV
jgi:hypothetical protein